MESIVREGVIFRGRGVGDGEEKKDIDCQAWFGWA